MVQQYLTRCGAPTDHPVGPQESLRIELAKKLGVQNPQEATWVDIDEAQRATQEQGRHAYASSSAVAVPGNTLDTSLSDILAGQT